MTKTPNEETDWEAIRKYLHLLARMLLGRRLQGKVDVSDVVQHTIMQAIQHETQFKGQADRERFAWLRTILTNHVTECVRHYAFKCRDANLERSIEQEIGQQSQRFENWLLATQTTPSQKMYFQEQLVWLASALADLPDDQRCAVEHYYLQQSSFEETAETMSRTKPAVAGLIYRAVTSLREKMSHDWRESEVKHAAEQ